MHELMRAVDTQFHQWATESRPRLMRTATLIAAGDQHLAEDVVQTTLTKIYLAWGRFRRAENPSAYARRVLMNVFADEMRSTRRKVEDLRADLPESAAPERNDDITSLLYAALRELPLGMRSMIVLRYFQDLTVEETARAMLCTQGTVKSQTARGMTKLRTALGPVLSETGADDDGVPAAARPTPHLSAFTDTSPVRTTPVVPLSTVIYARSLE